MRVRWVLGFAAAGATVLLAVTGASVGCGSDACVKDTDCALPFVCVRSACVLPGTGGDVPPPDVEADGIADGDEGDGDGEAIEGGDVPDDVEAGDDGGPCTPRTSSPLAIAATAADANERPRALADADRFVAFFRILSSTAPPQGLRFQRFRLDGGADGRAFWSQAGAEFSPAHPLLSLPGGGFAAVMNVVGGSTPPGIWVKILDATGTGSSAAQLPNTDENSRSPTATFDGTQLIVAWAQNSSAGDTVEIRALHVDPVTGTTSDSYATLASGPTGTGEPRIAWGATLLTLAYFDATDGAVHVVAFDGMFAVQSTSILPMPTGHSFIGYPSLVWNGSVYGLAWETRGPSSSTIHLAVFAEGETPVEHDPLVDVALSSAELGQVALAWGGASEEWGIAWRHSQAGRVGISLVTIDAVGYTLKEGPIDLRAETVRAAHPSLAYANGYYMVVWIEDPGTGDFPIYEATWGCTP